MLSRRVAAALPAFALGSQARFSGLGVKSQDPNFEDDRWLEAELEEHKQNKTPEERYAAEKQRDLMKKMMAKMRDERKAHVAEVQKEQTQKHEAEIGALKDQLASVLAKLEKIDK